ncbi:MAG: hypothetical protein MJ217_02860 [Bacilli bacterium]|nr:hypothetical protein [Bacilli bacterium]
MNQCLIGLQNEEDIVNYLDGKRLVQLNEKWKKHIMKMFPFVNDTDVIYSRKFPDRKAKPDIIVKVRHTCVYVSIKSGKNPSIHQEGFYTFSKFLSKLNVDEKTLRTIEFYHFGETKKLNNNGVPFTREELQSQFGSYILKANEKLDNKRVIEAVVNRTVIRGVDKHRTGADFLYYGSVDKGFLLSKEEIYSAVLSYAEHKNRPIHFGALNYQPSGRKRTTLDYRFVRIKWPLLCVMFYEKDKEQI